MRDAPDAADLVETAREALKAEILPGLSGDAAYAGAMIANALGIVLRDLRAGGAAGAGEAEALRALLGSEETDLSRLNAAFARRIREGRHDPGTPGHDAARAILCAQTRDRLARVAPKQLRAARQEGRMPDDAAPWPPDD